MGRIGLFGGAFDPPHLGHLLLAAETLALDEVWFALAVDPPYKQGERMTPVAHRLGMLIFSVFFGFVRRAT